MDSAPPSIPPQLSLPPASPRGAGLRLQIVVALLGLTIVSFIPLFLALAGVLRVTLVSMREESARGLSRAISAHVFELRREGKLLDDPLSSHTGPGGASAIVVYDVGGQVVARAGDPRELADVPRVLTRRDEQSQRMRGPLGQTLQVIVPDQSGTVLCRVGLEEDQARMSQVVRLFGLYLTVFAIALVAFMYFVLTRSIVRPVDELVRSADRVASGARRLDAPRGAARELVELHASLGTMTSKLLSNEAALKAKLDELLALNEKLTQAQAQLVRSEQMASVGQLAAGIAHEIGNPITAILGMHDLMSALDAEEQQDFLLRMRKETERISTIVRDLLDFARPERGAPQSGAFEPATLDAALKDVIALVRPQKSYKSIELSTELPDTRMGVALSKHKVTQVLLNLLLNAGQALEDRPSGKVWVRIRREERFARIEVEDDGPGIPQEKHEDIFLPFFTTKDVGTGTGLGLSVCRGIVESAGGKIFVDAEYTKGARIVTLLPLWDDLV